MIADMTATTFCHSAGITMLIRAKKQAAAHGPNSGCCCRAPPSCVSKMQGVDVVLPIYHSLEQALAGTGNGSQ